MKLLHFIQNKIGRRNLFFLAAAGIITVFFGTVYLAVQQDFRMTANDPQIQIAEDGARALDGGASYQAVLTPGVISIRDSLAPFVVIFGVSGEPVAASGSLDGQIPTLPRAVFDYVKANGEDRITWQPSQSVRIAAVIVPYTSGFILAGRSLKEIEKREDKLLLQILLGWLASLIILGIAFLLDKRVFDRGN